MEAWSDGTCKAGVSNGKGCVVGGQVRYVRIPPSIQCLEWPAIGRFKPGHALRGARVVPELVTCTARSGLMAVGENIGPLQWVARPWPPTVGRPHRQPCRTRLPFFPSFKVTEVELCQATRANGQHDASSIELRFDASQNSTTQSFSIFPTPSPHLPPSPTPSTPSTALPNPAPPI